MLPDWHREGTFQCSSAELKILTSLKDMMKAQTHCDSVRRHNDGRHARSQMVACWIEPEVAKEAIDQRLTNDTDAVLGGRKKPHNASVRKH